MIMIQDTEGLKTKFSYAQLSLFDQINELPEDGLKSSPETSRYTENKWISQKNQNNLFFLHLIDILNDLLMKWKIG